MTFCAKSTTVSWVFKLATSNKVQMKALLNLRITLDDGCVYNYTKILLVTKHLLKCLNFKVWLQHLLLISGSTQWPRDLFIIILQCLKYIHPHSWDDRLHTLLLCVFDSMFAATCDILCKINHSFMSIQASDLKQTANESSIKSAYNPRWWLCL